MQILKLRNFSFLLFSCALIMVAISCGDKEPEEEEEMGTCITDNLTYDNYAKDIINNNCATSGCHDADGVSNGTFPMNNYEAVSTAVGAGRMIGAISWDSGFSRMPKGEDQLSDCNVEKMTAWINAGAPE